MVERPRCSLSALSIRRTQLVPSTHEKSSEWENLIVAQLQKKNNFLAHSTRKQAKTEQSDCRVWDDTSDGT